jgi:hypothetical protein
MNAIIDTEFVPIKGPMGMMIQMLAGFSGSGQKVVNCSEISKLPVLTVRIGSESYELTGEDYVLREKDLGRTVCYVGI